jgi:hypothetical protein
MFRLVSSLCAVTLLFPAVGLASEDAAQQLESLRDVSEFQPLRVEDALPAQPGVQGQLSFMTADEEGRTGVLLRPQVSVGIAERLELGVGTEVGRLEGQSEMGPFEAFSLLRLNSEGALLPSLALKATIMTPTDEVGVAGELGARMTKTLRATRVHANATYTTQRDAGDRYLFGVGADTPLSGRVLLLGNAYVERLRDQGKTAVGGDAGASWQLTDGLMLQGAIGVQRTGNAVDPRILIGISAG